MSPNINLNTLVLFLAAGQGLVFAILLFFRGRKSRAINIHLSIILIAFTVEVIQKFLLDTHYIYQLPTLVGLSLPFDASVGIALYWYVRQATSPEKNNSIEQVLKHYSLFFICVILSIPLWLLDFDTKLAFMETGALSDDWPNSVYYSIACQTVIKIISFCVYLFISIKMLLEHKNRIKNIFSYKESITLIWLTNMLWLFLFGLIQGIATLVFFQESEEVTSIMGFMDYFYMVTIFYVGVMGLMQPRIYRRSERSYIRELKNEQEAELNHKEETQKEPELRGKVDVENTITNTENSSASKVKYSKSALSKTDMERITKKLEALMAAEPVYLEPDLSMPQLADKLSLSPNYLSQTINTMYQMSFFDYINKHRIEYAKQQLIDPNLVDRSVIDIAVDSAFNSRSAFYTAFKKHVGMTPVQFRKQSTPTIS